MIQEELDNLVASLTGGSTSSSMEFTPEELGFPPEGYAKTAEAIVPSIIQNATSFVTGQVYDAAKPTIDQAVSDGVNTAINTLESRVDNASVLPFGMGWPLVIGGVVLVAGLIGVGLYVTRGSNG